MVLCSSYVRQGLFLLTHLNRVGRGSYGLNSTKKGSSLVFYGDEIYDIKKSENKFGSFNYLLYLCIRKKNKRYE